MKVSSSGTSTTDSNEIAEVLNSHFAEVAARLASKIENTEDSINPSTFTKVYHSVFTLSQISSERVLKLLQNLDVSKAIGLDGIPNNLLKIAAPYIYRSLTDLFNLSLKTKTFPCEFKTA